MKPYTTVYFMQLMILFIMLCTGCKKDDSTNVKPEDYFMTATIDNKAWKASDAERSYFHVDYNTDKKRYTLIVSGSNENPTAGSRSITMDFDFMPKIGKYEFNNVGSLQKDSGIIAIYTYYTPFGTSYKWSDSGNVEIESITANAVKGTFNFTAKGDSTDSSITDVKSGSFYAYYSGSTGLPWPGP